MAAGALLYACLLPWVMVLSLAVFLLGPGTSISADPVVALLAIVPPVACTFLVATWIMRHPRDVRSIWDGANSRTVAGPREFIGVRTTLAVLAAACIGFLTFARLVFEYARIQGAIDEGLYLYAARLVMSGQIPYRDFYFDQAPLLPYAFGLALGPFGYDEVAARLFAIICTLLSMLVSFFAAARLGGRLAGLLAVGLLVTCVDFTSELSGGIQSNGGLTALTAALVGLALAYDRLGSALLVACVAAGLRQSFIPLPFVVACYVGLARGRPALALFGGIVPIVLLYGVSLVTGGDTALLAFVRPLRAPYVVRMMPAPGIDQVLSTFRDTLMRVVTAYFPFLLCAGPAAYLALRRGHPQARVLLVLGASCAMLLIADLLPFENNPRYPVTLLPLAAVLGGVSLVTLLDRAQPDARAALVGALALLLTVSPAIAYRDVNFVELFASHPPLARFQAAARYVRSHVPASATLVTLETPFASQTGLRLAHGLEAGSWGIYTNISTERAQQLGVLTYPMLADLVEQGVGDVVIESDKYGFVDNYANNDDQKHRVENALKAHYELAEAFGNISDWGNVRVWIKRS